MHAAVQRGVQRGGDGDGYGLALAGVHLHHPATEQVDGGQQLLVSGPEPLAAASVIPSNSGVELRGQQDVARTPVAALLGDDCDGILNGAVIGGDIHKREIIEQPPSAQPPVNGLADDGKALWQQFLGCRRLGPQSKSSPGIAQLGVGERRKVVATDAGQQGCG